MGTRSVAYEQPPLRDFIRLRRIIAEISRKPCVSVTRGRWTAATTAPL